MFVEYPLLLIDTLLFGSGVLSLILTIVFVCVVILSVSSEYITLSYIALCAYLLALTIFTPINVYDVVTTNPIQVLQFVVGYLLIGALYTVVKYRSYVVNIVNEVQTLKKRFIDENKLLIKVTDELPNKDSWNNFIRDYNYNLYYTLKHGITPGSQKTLITNWIVFWPFSAVGLFVAHPLEHVVTLIYNSLQSVYHKMYYKLITSKLNITDIEL